MLLVVTSSGWKAHSVVGVLNLQQYVAIIRMMYSVVEKLPFISGSPAECSKLQACHLRDLLLASTAWRSTGNQLLATRSVLDSWYDMLYEARRRPVRAYNQTGTRGVDEMTITLSDETDARLREKAEREGQDVNAVAESLIAAALEWEALDREAAIAGIRRGLEAIAAGRVRPAADVLEGLRTQLHSRG